MKQDNGTQPHILIQNRQYRWQLLKFVEKWTKERQKYKILVQWIVVWSREKIQILKYKIQNSWKTLLYLLYI